MTSRIKSYSKNYLIFFALIKIIKKGKEKKKNKLWIFDAWKKSRTNEMWIFPSPFVHDVLISTWSWNNDNQDRDGSSCKRMNTREVEREIVLHAKLNDSPWQRLHDLPHVNTDEPLCSIYTRLGYRIFHFRINHSYNRPSFEI